MIPSIRNDSRSYAMNKRWLHDGWRIRCASLSGMDPRENPDYLRTVAGAVTEFRDAFGEFMKLHSTNTTLARGLAPAVFPLDTSTAADIESAARKVDRAAGKACEAPLLTGVKIMVSGAGAIDPIAVWGTVRQPKPLLEPDNIISSCDQISGRLENLIARAEAAAPPSIGVRSMHPLVWGAAGRLWRDGHFRQAVAAAAEALVAQLKVTTGRNDIAETALWQEAFSDREPAPGNPRLRWPGRPDDRDVKTMNSGLRLFAPGTQLTIRNTAAHGTGELSEQEALERLATLSLLARWVDECEVVRAPD